MTIFYNKDRSLKRVKRLSPIKTTGSKIFLLISILGLALLSGCEEDPSSIGSGILPGSDFNTIAATDTFTVDSYTDYFDRILSYYVDTNKVSHQPQYGYLGSLFDPYFGITNSGFVTQLWLYYEWPRDHATLDSLMLTLHFKDIIQGSSSLDFVNIWEIDERLSTDSLYYSSHEVVKKQLLASFSLLDLPDKDTVITFKMESTFMNELMRDTTMIYLATDTVDFRDYFKGLYFEFTQLEDYFMTKIDLNGGYSNLKLHYTDTAGNNTAFTFMFNTKTVNFNIFEHDFEAAEPEKKIQYLNQEIKDTISYIQGFNGAFTTIAIPGLEQLKEQMPIGINKARLYLPAYSNETDFPEEALPIRIVARYLNENGGRSAVSDYLLSPYFMDGQYYSLDDYYVLNITTFVQDYLEGKVTQPRLELVLEDLEGHNLILWANDGTMSPRLEIVYTDL